VAKSTRRYSRVQIVLQGWIKSTQDPQLGVNDPNWVGREVKKRIIMRNRRTPHTMSSVILPWTPLTLEGDNGGTRDRGTTTCRDSTKLGDLTERLLYVHRRIIDDFIRSAIELSVIDIVYCTTHVDGSTYDASIIEWYYNLRGYLCNNV